jgi:hypothetical protein
VPKNGLRAGNRELQQFAAHWSSEEVHFRGSNCCLESVPSR